MRGKITPAAVAWICSLLLTIMLLLLKAVVAARYHNVNVAAALLFEVPFVTALVFATVLAVYNNSCLIKIVASTVYEVLLVVYLIDIGGQFCLFNRLRFDMLGYATTEANEYAAYIIYYFGTRVGWATILCLLLSFILIRCCFANKTTSLKPLKRLVGGFLLAGLAVAIPCGMLKSVKLQEPNVIHYNLAFGRSDYKNNYLPESWQLKYSRHGWEITAKPNVLMIVLESFNASSSQLFSGLDNLTPNLDRIAAQGTYFTNYFANGGASTESRFAILTGKTRINSNLGIDEPKFYEHNLIKYLNEAGIYTALFTSADDVFNSDKLFGRLPFQYRSKSDDPYYKNSKRMIFNSVPDHDMYGNLLAHLADKKLPEPYFAMLTTVSTHGPYIHPETGKESYEDCVRYADNELGLFFDQLAATDFFENGILVVVSDHHAMLPVNTEEKAKYGNEAHHRIPLLIVGKNIERQKRTERYDHGSFGAMLEKLQVGTYELHQYQGQPFAEKSGATILVSEYGDNKGWFYLPDGHNYHVQFKGNATGIIGMDENDARYKDFLYYIAWLSQNF